jgi:hypothetical protein
MGFAGAFLTTFLLVASPAMATETIGSSQAGDSTQAGPCGQATCVLFQDTAPNGSVISPSASGEVTDITIKKTAGALNIQPVVISPAGQVASYTLESIGATIALDPAAGNVTYPLATPLAIDPGDTVGLRYPDGPAPADPKLYNNDAANGGSMTRIGNTAAGPGRASARAYPFSARFANYNMNFKFTVTTATPTPTPTRTVDLQASILLTNARSRNAYTNGEYHRSDGTTVKMAPFDDVQKLGVSFNFLRFNGEDVPYEATAEMPPDLISTGGIFGSQACSPASTAPIRILCAGTLGPAITASADFGFASSNANPTRFRGLTGVITASVADTDPNVAEATPADNLHRMQLAVVNTPEAKFDKALMKRYKERTIEAGKKAELKGLSKAADAFANGDDRGVGTASPEDEQNLDAALAIEQVELAAARKVKKGCAWITGGEDRAAASCEEPQWTKAKGIRNWSLTLKKLKKGEHVVYVRALTASGIADSTFSKKDDDELRFAVK